jgi:hypothetical protein
VSSPLRLDAIGKPSKRHADKPLGQTGCSAVAVHGVRRRPGIYLIFYVLPANQHLLRADERTRTAYPCSSYEFACVHTSPSLCVRKLRLFMRFSMIWRYHFVQRVPVCVSPVAVRVAVRSVITRLIPLLRVAISCTVLRSRWYQSGIKIAPPSACTDRGLKNRGYGQSRRCHLRKRVNIEEQERVPQNPRIRRSVRTSG